MGIIFTAPLDLLEDLGGGVASHVLPADTEAVLAAELPLERQRRHRFLVRQAEVVLES